MNTALWVVQVVLAVLYVIAGLGKIMGQGPMLEKMMPGFSLALIRLVGLGETLAGLGPGVSAGGGRWAGGAGGGGAKLGAPEVWCFGSPTRGRGRGLARRDLGAGAAVG